MAGKVKVAAGIYPAQAAAQDAVGSLRGAGARNTEISVLIPILEDTAWALPAGLAGAGKITTPEAGQFAAAGPIVAALAAAVATKDGGVSGALAGVGVPEAVGNQFETQLQNGGALVLVHCESAEWVRRANAVLERTGASGIFATPEKSGDAGKPLKPKIKAAKKGRAEGDLYEDGEPPEIEDLDET